MKICVCKKTHKSGPVEFIQDKRYSYTYVNIIWLSGKVTPYTYRIEDRFTYLPGCIRFCVQIKRCSN